jgi:hypothetical protein
MSMVTSSAPSPGRVPRRALNPSKALGAVGSAWVMVYLQGGDLGCKLAFALRNLEILARGAPIYRGFLG